jgi:hypothetical protein
MHASSIGALIERVARIISNPASNLTGAVLLLAMLVLVLLILAVAALITILPGGDDDDDEDDADDEDEDEDAERPSPASGKKPGSAISEPDDGRDEAEDESGDEPPVDGKRGSSWVVALPLALLAIAVVWGWLVTGRPSTCSSCHTSAPLVDSWRAGDHRDVACVTCHEDGGVGLPASALYRLTDAVAAATGKELPATPSRPVPAYRCLRCHAGIVSGVTVSHNIRVSHDAFLARGYTCQRCHAGVGHTSADAANRAVGMNECLGCHDGTTASSACMTCHIKDPSTAVRLDRAVFPKVGIVPPPGCTGCHQTKTCLACHGTVMPHPPGFETGKGHAALAAFGKKQTLCYRCHTKQECRQCHKGDFDNHGPDWIKIHGVGIPLDGRNACACHQTPNFCGLCHKTSKG